MDDSEIYEKELIKNLIKEREPDLNIAKDKRDSIKNNTHIYDLINQSCNEHEVQSKENRECCDMIKVAEQTEGDAKIIERPIGFLKKDSEQVHIAIGFKTCNTYCIDRFALEMLSII